MSPVTEVRLDYSGIIRNNARINSSAWVRVRGDRGPFNKAAQLLRVLKNDSEMQVDVFTYQEPPSL